MDREVVERRRSPRLAVDAIRWTGVRMRPGREATLINLCDRGALVEGPARLHPGAAVVLHLIGPAPSSSIKGTIVRCHVSSICGRTGIRYRGAISFDAAIDMEER
jgi:hypothetical protein